MNSIDKLIQIFSQFPGIGPRQARRFVYYLLTRNNGILQEFSKNISDLKNDVVMCADCKRFFPSAHRSFPRTAEAFSGGVSEGGQKQLNLCKICSDETRDHSLLMLVQRDIDLESVEKNGGFNGIYFVLGGSVPILEKEPEKRVRIRELKIFLDRKIKEGLTEIILGVNWNPEGENTGDYVIKTIEHLTSKYKIKVSHLGKGLSMGTELEYADSDTLKNALRNRN